MTVQARRRDPEGSEDMFDPNNYYDLTTQRGVDNLAVNAIAAKAIGARALVVAPWIGVFKSNGHPRNTLVAHSEDVPRYRSLEVAKAINNARDISKQIGIKVALEHPTVPLYGDFNANIKGSMFDLGFGLFEHSSQVPGDMLVLDTCHIESARNIVQRMHREPMFYVPGILNAQEQPTILDAIKIARPFEVHYAGFGGEWNPYSTNPTKHIEGCVPGGDIDVIGKETFKELTKHLKERARYQDSMIERHFSNPTKEEDVVIVAEPNDTDFMNPVNAEETLRKIYSWMKE